MPVVYTTHIEIGEFSFERWWYLMKLMRRWSVMGNAVGVGKSH